MSAPPAFVEVNETAILMRGDHAVSRWWLMYRSRAERAGRVTVLASGVGDLLRVACEDREHAEWLAADLAGRGVPASAVRANGAIPRKIRGASGRGPRRIEGGS